MMKKDANTHETPFNIDTQIIIGIIGVIVLFVGAISVVVPWKINQNNQKYKEKIMEITKIQEEKKLEENIKNIKEKLENHLNKTNDIAKKITQENKTQKQIDRIVKLEPVDAVIITDKDIGIIQKTTFAKFATDIINKKRQEYKTFFIANDKYKNKIGIHTQKNNLMLIAIQPITNNDNVIGLVVAHSRVSEKMLQINKNIKTQIVQALVPQTLVPRTQTPSGKINKTNTKICQTLQHNIKICVATKSSEIRNQIKETIQFIQHKQNETIKWILAVSAITIILAVILAAWVVKKIMKPIQYIKYLMKTLVKENWKVKVIGTNRNDEIAEILKDIVKMQEYIKQKYTTNKQEENK